MGSIKILCNCHNDTDQLNTKRNHANDPLEVPIGPITRARTKKLIFVGWEFPFLIVLVPRYK
jgi:hypothetical protein